MKWKFNHDKMGNVDEKRNGIYLFEELLARITTEMDPMGGGRTAG